MKKRILPIFIVIIFTAVIFIVFSACSGGAKVTDGKSDGNDDGNADGKGESEPKATDSMDISGDLADKNGYFFKDGDLIVYLGQDFSEISEALGETLNYFEAPSCAFDGSDKIFYYANYKIYTFPDGEKDRVSQIVLSSDLVLTAEGVAIGDEREKVISACGEDYIDVNGSIKYEKSKTTILFIIEDGCVTSIQYTYNNL